jgi:hypothetical protein
MPLITIFSAIPGFLFNQIATNLWRAWRQMAVLSHPHFQTNFGNATFYKIVKHPPQTTPSHLMFYRISAPLSQARHSRQPKGFTVP